MSMISTNGEEDMSDQMNNVGGATGTQAPGGPGYGAQPPAGYGYPAGAPLPSGKATASMVLGILGLVLIPIILPIIALCLGISAKRMADRGEGGNRGQAVAGIVMGSIGIAFAALGAIVATIQAVGAV
jgi:thiol:disulfide interchange protein